MKGSVASRTHILEEVASQEEHFGDPQNSMDQYRLGQTTPGPYSARETLQLHNCACVCERERETHADLTQAQAHTHTDTHRVTDARSLDSCTRTHTDTHTHTQT